MSDNETGQDDGRYYTIPHRPEVSRARKIGPYTVVCLHPHHFWKIEGRDDGRPIAPELAVGVTTDITILESTIRVSLSNEKE